MLQRKNSNLSTSSSISSSDGKKKKNKPKRSIRIVTEQNSIHDVPHLDDMTSKDIANIWYDPKEYSEIKASYQLTIVRMEAAIEANQIFEETDEQTCRGLEYRTQTGAWARYENKRDAYNAVLDEQDRQWKNDKDDYEALSRVYIEHSAKCKQAAYQRGVEDASIARTICASLYNRKPKKSSSRTRSTSPSARTNRTPRSGTKSGSRSDSEDSTDTNKSNDLRNSNNVKKLLREQSFSRRNQIRDDISNIQQQKSTSSSNSTKPSSRTRSTSPKKDRSLSPKARSTSPKASRSSSKSATAVIAV